MVLKKQERNNLGDFNPNFRASNIVKDHPELENRRKNDKKPEASPSHSTLKIQKHRYKLS